MEKDVAMPKAIEYLASCKTIYLGTVNEKGEPEVRAMGNAGTEDLVVWMITNKSSRKAKHINDNGKACVYCGEWGEKVLMGLRLVGSAEMVDDEEMKKKMWKDEYARWYKQGVDDSEYVLIKFMPNMMYFHEGMDWCDCEV